MPDNIGVCGLLFMALLMIFKVSFRSFLAHVKFIMKPLFMFFILRDLYKKIVVLVVGAVEMLISVHVFCFIRIFLVDKMLMFVYPLIHILTGKIYFRSYQHVFNMESTGNSQAFSQVYTQEPICLDFCADLWSYRGCGEQKDVFS